MDRGAVSGLSQQVGVKFLPAAKQLVGRGRLRSSINRAYYAAYSAVTSHPVARCVRFAHGWNNPARADDTALRTERIRSWRERLPRVGFAFPGDPRHWEPLHGMTAALPERGQKLLGLQSWET
ncbi:MAG TPA: hypothetical protein VFB21_00835 [Chthonomonadaceae bacterium]|nr:hypothetical protein [Chthonomonadaceae bacterium]